MTEKRTSASLPPVIETFGDLLKYLRRRSRLTQRELGLAVGYSEAHISRIEKNRRPPDSATIAALFVPALELEGDPEIVARLLSLAASARGGQASPDPALVFSNKQAAVEIIESAAGIPANLPLQLTSFVGREAEITAITRRLSSADPARLLTLTGPGGIGKTRLAIEGAYRLLDVYPDGIWFIDLAPLLSPELLLQTVASTVNVVEATGRTILETLISHWQPKATLLVLDNCEHLLAAVAQLAEKLLRTCPRLQIMATSREALNLQGEIIHRVPALAMPVDGSTGRRLIAGCEAVELFVQRAQNSQPSFALTDDNAAVVARVCRRLDGMPLAIELAAARANLLRVEQIEARLDDRFRLLTAGRSTLPRQQTLLATLEWSYDLLEQADRALFRRLSVFSGGWTLEAAEAVCAEAGQDTLNALANLVNKSLAVAERQPGAEARYGFLETVHEFARVQLEAANETPRASARHFDYFFDLASKARTFGPDKLTWLNRLEAENDNLRSALIRSLETGPDGAPPHPARLERATFIVGWLADYYFYRGYSVEALNWFDKLLAFDLPPSQARALGFQKAGFLTRVHGDFEKAITLLERGLAMAREVGDAERAAWALVDLGTCFRDMSQMHKVAPCYLEALKLFEELGDQRGIVETFYMLAETYEQTNDLDMSTSYWERGLEISRRVGDQSYVSWGLEGLGGVAFLESKAAWSAVLHRESLALKAGVMDKAGIAYSFEGLAQAAAARGQHERAAMLWGASEHLRITMNLPLDPSRRHVYVSLIPSVRASMGTTAFEQAHARGRALALPDAIRFALDVQAEGT